MIHWLLEVWREGGNSGSSDVPVGRAVVQMQCGISSVLEHMLPGWWLVSSSASVELYLQSEKKILPLFQVLNKTHWKVFLGNKTLLYVRSLKCCFLWAWAVFGWFGSAALWVHLSIFISFSGHTWKKKKKAVSLLETSYLICNSQT